MNKEEMLKIMRLLSAIESALLMADKQVPSHLFDQIEEAVDILEREILK